MAKVGIRSIRQRKLGKSGGHSAEGDGIDGFRSRVCIERVTRGRCAEKVKLRVGCNPLAGIVRHYVA
jgi:hypothetical protein